MLGDGLLTNNLKTPDSEQAVQHIWGGIQFIKFEP
jgi:hypothetical protein